MTPFEKQSYIDHLNMGYSYAPIEHHEPVSAASALHTQVGGDHYKRFKIQPIEFILGNNLGFAAGCVIKYVCRAPYKGTYRQDLEKAKHYIDMMLEIGHDVN